MKNLIAVAIVTAALTLLLSTSAGSAQSQIDPGAARFQILTLQHHMTLEKATVLETKIFRVDTLTGATCEFHSFSGLKNDGMFRGWLAIHEPGDPSAWLERPSQQTQPAAK